MTYEELKQKVAEALDGKGFYLSKESDGTFHDDIYADYRDVICNDTAQKLLSAEDPLQAFDEWMIDSYDDQVSDMEMEIKDKLWDSLGLDDVETEDDLDDMLLEVIHELVCIDLPYDHYLDQKFHTNIFLDTGDGNYDYTLNSVYPCWYGREEWTIDDRASIVWLAKQQGYKKSELNAALKKGDIAHPHGFMESMRQELSNLPSHMSCLTFLVNMTLRELIHLNELIKLQDRDGRHYDSEHNPYCGYIVLDKKTETGLYDLWNGGGSIFEIELDKDVRLPIRFIRSALPDGADGRSIDDVYGMCGSVWEKSEVKKIHAPGFYQASL